MTLLPAGLSGEEATIVAAAVHDQRAFGPLATSGSLAALLIFVLPQALVRAWTATGAKKLFFSGAALVLLAGLWATGSVGAWCCLALVLFVLAWKQGLKKEALILLALGAVVVFGVVWGRGFHSWSQASYSMRLELWRSAWALFLQHPFLGSGLGTFKEAYLSAGFDLGTGSFFAHNLFLQLLAETGLVGTILFVLALWSVVRRFKWPALWEGWGVLGGSLAVLFFSFLDLPFQMPELIWIFAGVAGRLEIGPGKGLGTKAFPIRWLSFGLLAVLVVAGFWPPFRAWNFALLAISLWVLVAYLKGRWERMPFWVVAGVLYFALRAFNSPSAIGTVWFFDIVGSLLVFYLLLGHFTGSGKFLKTFLFLGLAWAGGMWWFSFQDTAMEHWTNFPNPKHLALFLVPLVFLLWASKRTAPSLTALVFALVTMVRLRSYGALAALAAGSLAFLRKRSRVWMVAAVLALVAGVFVLRTLDASPTKWERLGIWSAALRVWERDPWVGEGPGAFEGLYHQVKAPRTSGVSRYLMDARYVHNEYLELLTAFGLIGFLWVLCFILFRRPYGDDPSKRPAVIGLATASFFDFCLHTPLVALEAVGLMDRSSVKKEGTSCSGAFLALGVALGLFGSAAMVPRMLVHADELKNERRYPEAFRIYETAVRLNGWDARVGALRAGFLEDLYLSTKDPTWKRKADEAYEGVLGLERTEGQWKFENARRLTRRFHAGLEDTFEPIITAWTEVEKAMPFNAFVQVEKGNYYLESSRWKGQVVDRKWPQEVAVESYQKATELEPNFSLAWANLGLARVQRAQALRDRRQMVLAHEELRKALAVHDEWKNAPNIDPLERRLVDLPPATLAAVQKELVH
jgi:O-antigen ligase